MNANINSIYRMENNDLINVIIPVFNVEDYIQDCLDSILEQTYPQLEIPVVNDGSNDRSGIICDHYQKNHPQIKVIRQQNQGLSVARNVGLKAMHGKWVVFVDGNDYISIRKWQTSYIRSQSRSVFRLFVGLPKNKACEARLFLGTRSHFITLFSTIIITQTVN